MEIKQSAVLCRIQTCFPLDELKMGFFFPVFQALTKKKSKCIFAVTFLIIVTVLFFKMLQLRYRLLNFEEGLVKNAIFVERNKKN